jgi:hypothetical protein
MPPKLCTFVELTSACRLVCGSMAGRDALQVGLAGFVALAERQRLHPANYMIVRRKIHHGNVLCPFSHSLAPVKAASNAAASLPDLAPTSHSPASTLPAHTNLHSHMSCLRLHSRGHRVHRGRHPAHCRRATRAPAGAPAPHGGVEHRGVHGTPDLAAAVV